MMTRNHIVAITVFVACLLATPSFSRAQQELAGIISVGPGFEDERTVPCPPPEQPLPGGWYGDWLKMKQGLAEKTGTTFDLCIHYQAQAVLAGPGKGAARNTFWWHLNIEQRLWTDGRLIVSTRGGSGDGLANVLPTRLTTNWESFEPDPIYVSRVFLEQKLLNRRLTIYLGKIGIGDFFDTNAAGDWDFLSYSMARNAIAPMPWHVLGVVAKYDVNDWLYVQAGVADANGSPTETGFNTAFHGNRATFSMAEVGVQPKLGGRPGTYRLILWHDTRPVAREDGGGSKRGDTGFGLSFDQEIADKTVAFLRYGHDSPEYRDAEHFWSVGLKRIGPVPGRPDDVLGVGFAQEIMSKDWRRAGPHRASSESLFETYYSIKLAPWCSVVPDIQVILNPNADSRSSTAVVVGVNVKFSF
jgi:hypothetical protein